MTIQAVLYSSTLSHTRHSFRKNFLQILSEIFLSLRRNERHIVRNVHSSSRKVSIILVKLELSGQIFEKCSNIKVHENPSSRSRFVLWRRIHRQTDITKLTIAFAVLRTRLTSSFFKTTVTHWLTRRHRWCPNFPRSMPAISRQLNLVL